MTNVLYILTDTTLNQTTFGLKQSVTLLDSKLNALNTRLTTGLQTLAQQSKTGRNFLEYLITNLQARLVPRLEQAVLTYRST